MEKHEIVHPKGHVVLDDGRNRKETDNIITRGGAHYMATAVARLLAGISVPSTGNFYIGLGSDNSTNAGVAGPITGPKPVTGGSWNGPSFNDWRRTAPIADLWVAADSVKVVNEIITIFATIPDELFTYPGGTDPVYVREVVVGLSDTEPSADPYDVPAEKVNTVIARAVFFTIDGGNFVDDPYVKSPGGNMTVRYQIRFA